jgi:hypothetical protein
VLFRKAVAGRVYEVSDMKSLRDSALDFCLASRHCNDRFETRLAKYWL